jgi:hypothetical protein
MSLLAIDLRYSMISLNPKVFQNNVEQAPIRKGFGGGRKMIIAPQLFRYLSIAK